VKISKYIFFILAVSVIIVTIWFRSGLLFATAEEGPAFYSPVRTSRIFSDVWVRWGTGFSYPIGIPASLFLKLISPLEYFINPVYIQYLVFIFLIFSGMIGVCLLTAHITKSKKAALIAGLFYFLNLYTMSQVFRRALYVGMFSWAYFPIFMYLFIKWIEVKKLKYIIYLILSNFLFIYTFSNPGYIFSFILAPFIFTIYHFYVHKKKDERIWLFVHSIIFAIVFILINIWWVYPFISSSRSAFKDFSSKDLNFESLQGVSTTFPVSEILLLRQKGYFNLANNPELPYLSWGVWYDNHLPLFISTLILFLVIFGGSISRKKPYFLFLIILALTGLFISKGVNAPLGYGFYKWLFANFSFTSALRNPYEKFGIVWLLPYAIFFGIGVTLLFEKLKKQIYSPLIYIFLFSAYGALLWPMWSGKVFEDYYFVKVPNYYEQLNSYINQDEADARILLLPMVPDHGAAYRWKYRGTEPSEYLFDKVTISKQIKNDLYYSKKYEELKSTIENIGKFEDLLVALNIKYLVIREDLDWELVGAKPPKTIENNLRSSTDVKFIKEFDKLKLYEINKGSFGFVSAEGKDPPKISYKRVSPRKYKIQIENAKGEYNLLFKETYNEHWKVSINGEKLGGHYLLYDYANGWKINKAGDYTINLTFKVWPWE